MRYLIDTLGGLWELALMAMRSRCRLRSRYWRWRRETAFGNDPEHMPPAAERRRQILAFARWAYRMKRGR